MKPTRHRKTEDGRLPGSRPEYGSGWGEALKKARLGHGLSLKKAAEKVNVSKAYWRVCERGDRVPSAGLAAMMGALVGLSKVHLDAGVSNSLGRRFESRDLGAVESVILAALAGAGLDVVIQPGKTGGLTAIPDALVTLPDGRKIEINWRLL
ncbi:MAG: helix-turn-helix transcriptional regulator [Verrucomicrobia bacterium]|nr:helix-turn-helix transcriptional regulator [Verrucomicrobiota bacterium]